MAFLSVLGTTSLTWEMVIKYEKNIKLSKQHTLHSPMQLALNKIYHVQKQKLNIIGSKLCMTMEFKVYVVT